MRSAIGARLGLCSRFPWLHSFVDTDTGHCYTLLTLYTNMYTAERASHTLVDDVYYPQEALTTSTRTNTRTSTMDTRRPHACTHICAPGAPAGPAVQGLPLRREGLGGYVGQRLRHMASPAGTGRHATGRERLPPQYPARTHKHHHQRVRARKKTKNQKEPALSRGETVAAGLSHETTTALSHEVTDASPERVGVVWPGSG